MAKKNNPNRRPYGTDSKQSGDMDADDAELLQAVEDFKKKVKRPFPTLTDILGIVKQLGYRKPTRGVSHYE